MRKLVAITIGSLMNALAFAQAPPADPAPAPALAPREAKVVTLIGRINAQGPCGSSDHALQAGDSVFVSCQLGSKDPEALVELECGNGASQVLSGEFFAVISASGQTQCAISLKIGTAVASSNPDDETNGGARIDTGLLSANSSHTQFGVTVTRGQSGDAEAFVLEGEASISRNGETRKLSNGQMLYAKTLSVTALPDDRLKLYANNFARVSTVRGGSSASREKIAASYYAAWKKPEDASVRTALATELAAVGGAPTSLARYQTVRATRLRDRAAVVPNDNVVQPMGAYVGPNNAQMHNMLAGKLFAPPKSGNYRVDICLHWGAECGQAAADEFCKSQNFASAAAFDYDNDVGAQSPTLVLGDNKVCNTAACDAFKSIRCQ